jgi:NAD(P)-dependent dehydrogenase (short-subunit alcohol dehydrogenase family)
VRADPDELVGKVAIVTGGGSGIGEAAARHLASAGADVVLAGRRLERLDAVADDIRVNGRRCLGVPTDVRLEEDIHRFVDTTIAEFGHVDIVVNNAGGDEHFPMQLETTPLDRWDSTVAHNLRGPFMLTQAAGRHMLAEGRGVFVNISSGAGLTGVVGGVAYSCAKAGLQMLTKVVAKEWGPRGIQANCIAVGAIVTEGATYAWSRLGTAGEGILERAGHSEDIAVWVLYLATDTASFMNGETIAHTGGLVL